MAKTVVVEVRTHKRHPKYHKAYSVTKRYKAHTEEPFEVGDKVSIVSCKPISGDKRFKVVKKV
jgi:small subunit ribosomal protein S17